jgi:hypothetical protein
MKNREREINRGRKREKCRKKAREIEKERLKREISEREI